MYFKSNFNAVKPIKNKEVIRIQVQSNINIVKSWLYICIVLKFFCVGRSVSQFQPHVRFSIQPASSVFGLVR
jgi:hypothetical protein